MKFCLLLTLLAISSLILPGSAQTLIGTHPGVEWLTLSPDGRWLDAGSATNEISESEDSDTWRYDLWHGGHSNLGESYGYTWLANGLVATPGGTGDEDIKVSTGMDGQSAPVISLARPWPIKPLHIYHDQMFARDPYMDTRLSQNRRQLWIYSLRWIRRFDLSSGHLLDRTRWPLPANERGHVSPDGRWILATDPEMKSYCARLYDYKGRVCRNFPARNYEDIISEVWLSPTVFVVTRKWATSGESGQERVTTEFYDALTLRRLWVLSPYVVREKFQDPDTHSSYYQNFWRTYFLIPQNDSVIVCGKNIWTWRDMHSGQILRQATRPKYWTLDQAFGADSPVHGDFCYSFDSKGHIWRERFRFLPLINKAAKSLRHHKARAI